MVTKEDERHAGGIRSVSARVLCFSHLRLLRFLPAASRFTGCASPLIACLRGLAARALSVSVRSIPFFSHVLPVFPRRIEGGFSHAAPLRYLLRLQNNSFPRTRRSRAHPHKPKRTTWKRKALPSHSPFRPLRLPSLPVSRPRPLHFPPATIPLFPHGLSVSRSELRADFPTPHLCVISCACKTIRSLASVEA